MKSNQHNPTLNKLIKSKKYQGVYSKLLPNNEVMMYIAYKNANGNYSRYKVGIKSSGITEQYCYNLRNQEINRIKLGDTPSLQSKRVILFKEIAEDYFYNMKLNQCSDTRNSYNKYLNHIYPVFGNINIESITTEMIQEFKIKKLQDYAPATVAMHIGFISSIYNHSIKKSKKFNKPNPAYGIESSIVIDNVRERFLNIEEIELLLEVLKENRFNKNSAIAKYLELFVQKTLQIGHQRRWQFGQQDAKHSASENANNSVTFS